VPRATPMPPAKWPSSSRRWARCNNSTSLRYRFLLATCVVNDSVSV
jgi:hypothetical protein